MAEDGRGCHSGRGRGRSSGRKNNKSGKGSNAGSSTKLEMKFAPHTSGKSSCASFATVKQCIVEYVQKSFIKAGVDLAKYLKKMEWLDLDALEPVCEKTKKAMDQGGAEEEEMMKLKWQEQCAGHLDRVRECKDATCRAYALIKSQF